MLGHHLEEGVDVIARPLGHLRQATGDASDL
jgi:hypothetical protein